MFIDRIEFHLRDNRMWSAGGDGGEEILDQDLLEDEAVLAVEQVHNGQYLGASIMFETSKGEGIRIAGWVQPGKKWVTHRLEAPPGQQIIGLHFEAGALAAIDTEPWNESGAEGEPRRKRARLPEHERNSEERQGRRDASDRAASSLSQMNERSQRTAPGVRMLKSMLSSRASNDRRRYSPGAEIPPPQ
ncbi:unnamed protein product [Polarella glacialis]|uniref:Uncharacterized protein n=1 Tax=Polarella glacialis TaxID=89957 RepID=A0A813I309_POLGL|nr:unnamed protein product [Polarella glacialis]